MSEFNFKVGDKIRDKGWDDDEWLIIRFIDDDVVYGRNENNVGCSYDIDDGNWLPYEEPKPEFDWDADGFWGNRKGGGSVKWFAKTSKWTWLALDKDGRVYGDYDRKSIVGNNIPCPPPEWANQITEAK